MCMRHLSYGVYIRSYIHTFFIPFVRSIDQRRLSFIPLRNRCARALKRYFKSGILSLFFMFHVFRSDLYIVGYFCVDTQVLSQVLSSNFVSSSRHSVLITFSTQNFILSLLTFHWARSIFSFIYATQCFFLDITCIRWDAQRMRCMFWESIIYLLAHRSARNQKQPF